MFKHFRYIFASIKQELIQIYNYLYLINWQLLSLFVLRQHNKCIVISDWWLVHRKCLRKQIRPNMCILCTFTIFLKTIFIISSIPNEQISTVPTSCSPTFARCLTCQKVQGLLYEEIFYFKGFFFFHIKFFFFVFSFSFFALFFSSSVFFLVLLSAHLKNLSGFRHE